MNHIGKLIGETDTDHRRYLQDLVSSQKRFILTLEETAIKHPQLTQEIAEVLRSNKKILEKYQARLRREIERALSAKKV